MRRFVSGFQFRFVGFVWFVWFVGFASLLAVQTPVPPGQARPSPQPTLVLKAGAAIILGKVVEAGTTTGVPNAVVMLAGTALGSSTAVFSNGVPGGSRRVAVDAQGQFLFRDLPAGEYRILSTAAGYVDGAYGDTRPIQIRRSRLDVTRTLELTNTDKLVTVSIQMWKFGGISGRVVDEAGEPIVGAPVSVVTRPSDSVTSKMNVTTSVTTDDRGLYHADVAPGDYIVGLLAATTTVPVSAADDYLQAQRSGGLTEEWALWLSASGGLTPRAAGARVGNFIVSQFGSQRNTWVVRPIMSEGGSLSFHPTMFHPSSLTAMSAAVVSVASGEEKAGIDVQLRKLPARRLSGRIVGPSGPVGEIALSLIAADPAGVRWNPVSTIEQSRALADANGEFTFLGVAPGSYTLMAVQKPLTSAEPLLWAADPVSIGGEDVTDLRVTLRTGGRISGRVVVESTGPPPAPATLKGLGITAYPMPGSLGASMATGQGATMDASLRFTTRQVIPGPVTIIANVPPGWILKSVTTGGRDALDRSIEVTVAGVDDIVVTITNRVSTLTGIVRTASGQPAVAATVAVFPTDQSFWRLPEMAFERIWTAAPGRDGRYTFRGLPPGEYLVVAADWPTADFADGGVLTALASSATRVAIGDGESRTQDLRVTVIR